MNTKEVCYTDADGLRQTLVAHYAYGCPSGTLLPKLLRTVYTSPDGTPVDTAGGTVSVGVCETLALEVVPGALGTIAGPVAAATAEFFGLASTASSSAIPGDLQSITVTARGVTDGGVGLTPNQIIVTIPNGEKIALFDGQSFTWATNRDQDFSLGREITFEATGTAYANIGYAYTNAVGGIANVGN